MADGYFPGTSDPKVLAALIESVRVEAEKNGRDPAEIKIHSIFGAGMADPVKGAEALKELGVDRVMVPAFFFVGAEGTERLTEFGEGVVRQFAD